MGGLNFASPLLLAGLVLLPALYLLLRRTPPPPRIARLPSLKLLPPEDLPPERAKRPPWLILLLRALIAVLLILGLAGPRWQDEPAGAMPQRMAIILDNGWAAAPRWTEVVEAAERRIEALASAGTQFALIPTAASTEPSEPVRFVDAETALAALSALSPRPWQLDRAAAARLVPDNADTLWISDGYESEGAAVLRSALGDGELLALPARTAVFAAAEPTAGGFAGRLIRPESSAQGGELRLLSGGGRELESRRVEFENGSASFRLQFSPSDRADAARLSAGPAAASTVLLTGTGEQPRVGLVDANRSDPPLQTGAFYIRRAAEPDAEIVSLELAEIPQDGANLFFLDDVPVPESFAPPLLERVEEGAVLVSFAGPRIAENGTALAPLPLRAGARAFGGALTWQEPMAVTDFAEDGPLAGLPISSEALVRRQLLTEAPADDTMIWAELADGTPLVTASRVGDGLVVLVHTSAAPDWSDLPLSGLFEAMIGRFLPLASNPAALDIAADEPWRLVRQLDARGSLSEPDASISIDAQDWEAARAGPETPPGLYQSGDLVRALNLTTLIPADYRFEPLQLGDLVPAGDVSPPLRFGPWLLTAAALLFILDCIIALALRGALRPARAYGAPATAMALAAILVSGVFSAPASAQEEGGVQLAYIGGTSADPQVEAGLAGLSRVLARRTAVATADPVAVRPGDPGLGRYPLIYWPAYARGAMSAAEAANIRGYLARGGLILFDFGQPLGGNTDARQLLSGLALPRLGEVGPEHVLMKSYYILRRPRGGALWVEAGTEGDSGTVSGVAIGGGDWARVWSGAAAVPPSEREQALRFGVNLVMYALTGTYKADQVHTETLLDRIGGELAE